MAPSMHLCLSFPVPPSLSADCINCTVNTTGQLKGFSCLYFSSTLQRGAGMAGLVCCGGLLLKKFPLGTRINVASQKSVRNCCLCTATDGKNMLTKSTVCVCESRQSDLLLPYAPSTTLLLVAVEEKPSQFCSDKCRRFRSIPAICSLTLTSFIQVHSVSPLVLAALGTGLNGLL